MQKILKKIFEDMDETRQSTAAEWQCCERQFELWQGQVQLELSRQSESELWCPCGNFSQNKGASRSFLRVANPTVCHF